MAATLRLVVNHRKIDWLCVIVWTGIIGFCLAADCALVSLVMSMIRKH